jgi:hypothetical protein
MTGTDHILGLALLIAGLLSECVTDTLRMVPDMNHLMIVTMEDTVTGRFLEVSHQNQGGQGGATREVSRQNQGGQGGATREVPLLFEVSPPGQERDQEGVIQEALEGVVVIPKLSILDQEAQV